MKNYTPRLEQEYKERIIKSLMNEFGYKSVMQAPKLTKIVVSRGVGDAVTDKKLVDYAVEELNMITGQKAIATISKKDVAAFKLRKGMPIGAKVTLRKDKMYEFLDRLITIALPRVRDFQGIKADGFDGRGNYNLGVTEQIIFPEIDFDKINKINGMDITFVTTAQTDKEAKALLTELGLPFKKKK
ncbi:MAG: 50S ribosomal protein L5 [Chlorobi bacterium]|nr:50S ribosomal protein L5 [Chlorobiota bacterium]